MYRRHAAVVYRYALLLLRSPADAEDVTQTTFVRAYRALRRGSRVRNPKSWLLKIAHNECLRHLGSPARGIIPLELDEAMVAVPEDEDGPTAAEIRDALEKLGFNQRAALVMRELEDRSYAEIAEVLGLSVSAVETLLFRARRALREQLEGDVACADVELLLSKQIDGELAPDERRRLRAHVRGCASCATLERSQRGRRAALRRLGGAITLPSSLGSFAGGGGGVVAGGVTVAVGAKAAAVVVAALTVTGVGVGVGDAQWGRPAGTASGGAVVRVDAPVTGQAAGGGRPIAARKPERVAPSFSAGGAATGGRAADAAGTRERGRPAPGQRVRPSPSGASVGNRAADRGAPVSAEAEAGAAAGSTVASAATTARLPEAQAATAPRPSATSAHDPGRTTRALPSTPSVSAAVPTATVPSVTVPSVTVPSVTCRRSRCRPSTVPSLPTPVVTPALPSTPTVTTPPLPAAPAVTAPTVPAATVPTTPTLPSAPTAPSTPTVTTPSAVPTPSLATPPTPSVPKAPQPVAAPPPPLPAAVATVGGR